MAVPDIPAKNRTGFGDLPDIATSAQVAQYTQTSIPTLMRWRGEGKGPKAFKLGGALRYRRADVLAWIDSLAEAS